MLDALKVFPSRTAPRDHPQRSRGRKVFLHAWTMDRRAQRTLGRMAIRRIYGNPDPAQQHELWLRYLEEHSQPARQFLPILRRQLAVDLERAEALHQHCPGLDREASLGVIFNAATKRVRRADTRHSKAHGLQSRPSRPAQDSAVGQDPKANKDRSIRLDRLIEDLEAHAAALREIGRFAAPVDVSLLQRVDRLRLRWFGPHNVFRPGRDMPKSALFSSN